MILHVPESEFQLGIEHYSVTPVIGFFRIFEEFFQVDLQSVVNILVESCIPVPKPVSFIFSSIYESYCCLSLPYHYKMYKPL